MRGVAVVQEREQWKQKRESCGGWGQCAADGCWGGVAAAGVSRRRSAAMSDVCLAMRDCCVRCGCVYTPTPTH